MVETRHRQTIASQGPGVLRLPVSRTLNRTLSPYFRCGTGRVICLTQGNMNFLVDNVIVTGGGIVYIAVSLYDGSDVFQSSQLLLLAMSDIRTNGVTATVTAAITTYATANSISVGSVFWASAGLAAPSESSLSLSVQTSTGAVGTQVSATQDSYVMVSTNVSTVAGLAAPAAGDLVLEIAPTNSATAGDWVEKARNGNSQSIALLAVSSTQGVKGQMVAFVPKGYYAKVRSVTASGSPTYSIVSARKVLI